MRVEYFDLTVSPGILPIEGCGVRGLSEAGWSKGVEVDLLHQLQDGDVVTQGPGGRLVVFVVHNGLHLDVLQDGGVCGGGKVVFSKSHLEYNTVPLENSIKMFR